MQGNILKRLALNLMNLVYKQIYTPIERKTMINGFPRQGQSYVITVLGQK